MSVDPNDLQEPEVQLEPVGMFATPSIVDVLQQEMQELAEAKTVHIPVVGYGQTGLQIMYHMPERGKELDEIGRKAQREFKDNYSRNLTAAIDTMIHLCEGIYVQPPGVDKPVMLDPNETGQALTFSDPELATILGIKMDDGMQFSARGMVRRLFGGNDMAILTHAEKLSRWLVNSKVEISTEVWDRGE